MKDRIKRIREHFGLSQAQFAQRINRSPGFISLVEIGRSNVSDETIETICSVLPVNEEWLRTGNGEMTSSAPVDKENIGQRIREIRKGEGLTQKQFASATGYTKMHIHFVEVGKIHPSDKFLHEVASAFNIRYEWIITGDGERHSTVEDELSDELISWLIAHPDVIRELKVRSGVK